MSSFIRNADVNDCAILGKIHSETWKVAYKGIVPDSILDNMSAEKSEKRFYDAISQGRENNVLIIHDDQIAGFMCLGKCRDSDLDDSFGEIWGIYLLPAFWREGLGTKLIHWGTHELHNRGYTKISLWVLEENISAREFYEKRGFSHDGTIKEIKIGKSLFEYRYVLKLPD